MNPSGNWQLKVPTQILNALAKVNIARMAVSLNGINSIIQICESFVTASDSSAAYRQSKGLR
jgi:hypothetical protein